MSLYISLVSLGDHVVMKANRACQVYLTWFTDITLNVTNISSSIHTC
jgi:hypothetical protein